MVRIASGLCAGPTFIFVGRLNFIEIGGYGKEITDAWLVIVIILGIYIRSVYV